MLKFHLTRVSKNSKTGPIPTVMISRQSCPPSCPLYAGGCYALGGNVRIHWNGVDDRGMSFDMLLDQIRSFPTNQIWRYAVAGDLPGVGEAISPFMLHRLTKANDGRRGYTYTHKNPYNANNSRCIAKANSSGFTINLSSNNVEQADECLALGIGPVVTLIPNDFGVGTVVTKHTGNKPVSVWRNTRTPAGALVVQCPAEYGNVQCANCGGGQGPLCWRSSRNFVVGFTTHGAGRFKANAHARKGLAVIE